MGYKAKIGQALQAFYHEKIPDKIAEELPLLNEFASRIRAKDIFSNTDIVFIQHHLGPFIPKIDAMIEKGLEKQRCWFIDIPYSTNAKVRSELEKLQFPVDHMALPFNDPIEDYDESQSARVSFLMLKLAKRDISRRLLVIDDGAYFARFLRKLMLHAPELKQAFANACIVEQTTRGHRFLLSYGEELAAFFNVKMVSIARCKTKLKLESPFIGAAVARAIMNSLKDSSLLQIRQIAIIGFGAVGEATVKQIAAKTKGSEIDIVEVSKQKLDKIRSLNKFFPQNHFRGLRSLDTTKRYELVIGCTGYNSFRIDQRDMLADKAILVSGSSAAVEFNRAGFVELADRYPDDALMILDKEKTRKRGIHATIKLSLEGGRTAFFLNAGFPANFDGKMECLPLRVIQATHTLLYAAAVQALRQKKAGLNTINQKDDEWIFENALHQL